MFRVARRLVAWHHRRVDESLRKAAQEIAPTAGRFVKDLAKDVVIFGGTEIAVRAGKGFIQGAREEWQRQHSGTPEQ